MSFCFHLLLVEQSVAEEHEDTANHEHDGYNHHTIKAANRANPDFGGKTDEHSRQHTDDEPTVELHLLDKLIKIAHLEKSFPIKANDRQDSAKLDDERKRMNKRVALLDT